MIFPRKFPDLVDGLARGITLQQDLVDRPARLDRFDQWLPADDELALLHFCISFTFRMAATDMESVIWPCSTI